MMMGDSFSSGFLSHHLSFLGAGAGGFHQGRQTESVPHHWTEYRKNPEGDHGELH